MGSRAVPGAHLIGAKCAPYFLRGCAGKSDQRERQKPRRQACSTGRENVRSGVWGNPNRRIGISKRISRYIACLLLCSLLSTDAAISILQFIESYVTII